MPVHPVDYEQAVSRIARGKYVSLTTFRRNGQAVVTPVGCVVENGVLYALTPPDTGKVKRIRANGRAVIAPCSMHGTIPSGAPSVEGAARLLDEAETARVQGLMVRRSFMYRLVRIADRAVRRHRPLVAVAVTAP
jgi:PPOX class probable F420-dependent enzyme